MVSQDDLLIKPCLKSSGITIMKNVNCAHCTKQFGAVDSFVEVETAAIVGSTQSWPHHLHHPGKERPPPCQEICTMIIMIMEMVVITIIVIACRYK